MGNKKEKRKSFVSRSNCEASESCIRMHHPCQIDRRRSPLDYTIDIKRKTVLINAETIKNHHKKSDKSERIPFGVKRKAIVDKRTPAKRTRLKRIAVLVICAQQFGNIRLNIQSFTNLFRIVSKMLRIFKIEIRRKLPSAARK